MTDASAERASGGRGGSSGMGAAEAADVVVEAADASGVWDAWWDAAVDDAAEENDAQVLACLGPVEIVGGSVSAREFGCCVENVRQSLPDSSWIEDAGNLRTDPSLANCCRAILARVLSDPASEAQALGSERFACCSTAGWPDVELVPVELVIYCTPWGPAVPPSLDWMATAVA